MVEKAVEKLSELGYINDLDYAVHPTYWEKSMEKRG